MNPLAYLVVAALAFVGTTALNYRARVKEEVVLIIGETCYHLHHWMTAVGAIILLVAGSRLPAHALWICVAIVAGIAVEGALFSDWWRIREHCERAFTISPLAFSEGGLFAAKPI